MSLITVIVPVLARPQNVERVIQSIVEGSETDPEILFVCSRGDHAEMEEIRRCGFPPMVVSWEPGSGDYAKKINWATAAAVESTYVFTGADDLVFHRGWDTRALEFAEQGFGVVGTEDLWNPEVALGRHSTHSLVNCEYVRDEGASWDGPGILYHEGYDHQCVDSELYAVAKQRDEWAFAWGSIVEHMHPLAGKSERDATYDKALLHGQEDVRLFFERSRLNGWTPS